MLTQERANSQKSTETTDVATEEAAIESSPVASTEAKTTESDTATRITVEDSSLLKRAIAALPFVDRSRLKASRPLVKVMVAIAVASGGVGAWTVINGASSPDAAPAASAMPPRPVEVVALEVGDGTQELALIGEVEAADQAMVRSQASGTVRQVLVNVGDRVQPGQTVAVLDNSDQRLALAEANAALASAQSSLSRMEAGTRPEVVAQRRAELRAAQAREAEARTNVQNVQALLPSLLAQREAELAAAQSTEVEAADNLERTRALTDTGALSRRAFVEAQSRANGARSERLRAQSGVAAQRTENQQRLSQARATLDTATSERLRAAAQLAEATAGPRREDIAAQRGVVRSAQSAVAQAQLQLNRTAITADAAGIVSQRPVNVGDYVDRNDQVVEVVSRDRLDIFLDVPERYTGQVQPGMAVTLTANALPTWEGQATIAGVVPTADAASRRQRVRVRLEASPEGLLPGMAIAATMEMPTAPLAEAQGEKFVVSRDSLTRRLDQWVVFVYNEGAAREVPVDLITDMGETVAIASPDLQPGQSLVSKGGDGLRDGVPIQVTNDSMQASNS